MKVKVFLINEDDNTMTVNILFSELVLSSRMPILRLGQGFIL